jgi:hypothetical protein
MSVKDELGSVSGLLRVPRLFEQVEGSIVTRMSRLQVLDLAGRLLRVPADRVHGIVFGHTETVPYRTEKKWSVLLPDQSAIQGRLENLFSEAPPGAEPRGAICPPADVALARKARSGPAAGPELPQQSVLEEK